MALAQINQTIDQLLVSLTSQGVLDDQFEQLRQLQVSGRNRGSRSLSDCFIHIKQLSPRCTLTKRSPVFHAGRKQPKLCPGGGAVVFRGLGI